MINALDKKPIAIQCLNIDCPRCGAVASFDCRNILYGELIKPHNERVRAMQALIGDSKNDWVVRKLLRERNFSK